HVLYNAPAPTYILPLSLHDALPILNRGFAALGDSLFLGTLDAHLVALDRRSGRMLWDVEVADYKTGYSITVAPLAVKDKIITGRSEEHTSELQSTDHLVCRLLLEKK